MVWSILWTEKYGKILILNKVYTITTQWLGGFFIDDFTKWIKMIVCPISSLVSLLLPIHSVFSDPELLE